MYTNADLLKKVHDGEWSAVWYAGSLEIAGEGNLYHDTCWTKIEGMFDSNVETVRHEYTPEERYWWCKCYVKHKTPNHSFYEEAKNFIEQYEIQ